MASNATRPARGMTLEEWESKTQLTDTQKQSVLELQEACVELPLPDNFLEDKVNSPTPYLRTSRSPDPTTPPRSPPTTAKHIAGRLGTSPIPRSRSTTNLSVESETATSLGISEPIETTQQFFDWFAQMETEMEKDQEDVYRNYLAIVTLYRQACDEFLEQIDTTARLFVDLDGNFRYVEERTRALQLACEKLLQEQDHLTALADGISSKLAFFNQLEAITKMFNAPGEHVVLQDEFVRMLEKLDECLEYVQDNLKYRDSELYLMRFRQCMTRGMTLIKMYFMTTLRGLGFEVSKKASTNPMNASTQSALFYVKFRTAAPKLKALVYEIEKRCPGHREYYALLNDCYNAYFTVRQSLLNQVVGAKILELGPRGEDLLSFAQNGCAYMMNLCSDEYSLFYTFFQTGEDELYGYLDLLLSYLYDYLRPRIIHENRIEVLSEICSIFQIHLIRDMENAGLDDSQGQGLAFSYLIRHVLQDAQQRLIFRAQTYIRTEIQVYVPKPEDLDYPTKLRSLRRSSILQSPISHSRNASSSSALRQSDGPATLTVEEDASETATAHTNEPSSNVIVPDAAIITSPTRSQRSLSLSFNPNIGADQSGMADIYKGWYPTLQRTLWILSKLYRCVKTSVFEDLSQEAVSLCRQSLLAASESITTKQSKVDGQLFLIKHLLILKEQIAPFEANFVHSARGLDFSAVLEAYNAITQGKASIFNPNALFNLAQKGIPRVVEINADSKREVDKELKRVCEEFILETAKAAVEPLSSFLLKVSAFRLRNDLKPSNQKLLLREQPFALQAMVADIADAFRQCVQSRLTFAMTRLSEYLSDRKTEIVLLKPMQTNIIDTYKTFYDTVQYEYDLSTFTREMDSVEEMAGWISKMIEDGSQGRGFVPQ